VAKVLSRNGAVAITAAISPYQDVRDEMRRAIGRFVEVYVRCPIEVLTERDVKGLYKKALAGEIKHFTGVDDPYEAPAKPEILIDSDKESVAESVAKIIRTLEVLEYVPRAVGGEYSEAEEETIKKRLKDLGYI
jgi:adenylylsulfate kinase-like enzyme